MSENKMDLMLKDRVVYITTFADALVYLVDTINAHEDNELIIQKAASGELFDYIYNKYINEPIIANLSPNNNRYLNPLYRIGFEVAEGREKYKHAKNNGLLNIIGVTFDIVVNWDEYCDDILKELNNGNM